MLRTGSGSLFSSPSSFIQSNKVADKVQRLEAKLKAKISVDFNSVRKAFLAIDDKHVGYINAESLARYLGASNQKYFDFTLLEIIIKMHTSKSLTRINYNDFCAWLGSSIEPTETFYFRHDSKKNPQFEISFRKNVEKNLPSHRNASEVLTRNNLKQKLLHRSFLKHSNLRSVFDTWRNLSEQFIQYERFSDLMGRMGFVTSEEEVRELFKWLDFDKDGQLSYDDLRETIGQEIAPNQKAYFRQQIHFSKSKPCKYESCWEDTLYNNKSNYCPLHQKVMKNSSIDLFNSISEKLEAQEWELFTSEIIKLNYQVTLT